MFDVTERDVVSRGRVTGLCYMVPDHGGRLIELAGSDRTLVFAAGPSSRQTADLLVFSYEQARVLRHCRFLIDIGELVCSCKFAFVFL